MTNALRKPTTTDASALRETAEFLGIKVRVKVCRWSIRIIGATADVRTLAFGAGLCGPAGADVLAPHTVPDYDGQTEFFAYVPA